MATASDWVVEKLEPVRLRSHGGADHPGAFARMRELRASGLGFDRIAAQLNAKGHKPRRGKRWWGLAVNKILSRAK